MTEESPDGERLPRTVRPGRGGFVLAVLVLVVSTCLVLLVWRAAREREMRAASGEFSDACNEITLLLRQRLINYELTLRGGVSLFATVARPSPREWQRYVEGLRLGQRFPALTGLGFAEYLTPEGLARRQAAREAGGTPAPPLWPAGERAHYGPILYLEPRTPENLVAMGFDMYADAARHAAMAAARDTGEMQMTAPVRLVQDAAGRSVGILVYAPVYRAGDAPLTAAQRRASMQGWVYVPVRVARFIAGALAPARRTVAFRLMDVSGAVPQILHVDPGFTAAADHAFENTVYTAAYGRRWRIDFRSGPVETAVPGLSTLNTALFGGLLASLLLFGVVWSMAHTEANAQRIAARMTIAHRRSEERVRALNRSLEARVGARTRELSEANRELESFSYSVSHDLRAPLRSIEGFSRILADRYGPVLDETGRDYLRRVRNAASRMSELIESLLKLSRVGRGQLRRESLDLSRMGSELVTDLRSSDPDRQVDVFIAPGLRAHGDPVLVRSLLQNLLGNAWKYTRGSDAPRIVLGADDRAGGAFYVRDNGVGFSQEYADKLFRPFQRVHADPDFTGEGIGLASVKRIVERHGGTVAAEGREGEGATFWFTLPVEGDDPARPEPA